MKKVYTMDILLKRRDYYDRGFKNTKMGKQSRYKNT